MLRQPSSHDADQQFKIGHKRKTDNALNLKRRNSFGSEINCETASVGKGTYIVDPAEDYDYVVITTEALKYSGGEYRFQDMVARKNQKGVKAATTTTLFPTNIMIYTKNHSNLHQQNNFRILPPYP